MPDRPYGDIWQVSFRKRDPGISGGLYPETLKIIAITPSTIPPAPALTVETLCSPPATLPAPGAGLRTPHLAPPSAGAFYKSILHPGLSRKTGFPGGLLIVHLGNPPGRHYDAKPKMPARNGYVQGFSVKNAPSGCGVALPADYRPARERPALPRDFNLACRERPAAEPAAVDIRHHGIDLP